MKIGTAIKTLRLKRDVPQQNLAKKVGITQGFLSLIERDAREPSFELIGKIASELKVPTQLLLLLACDETPRQRRYSKPLQNIALAIEEILNAVSTRP